MSDATMLREAYECATRDGFVGVRRKRCLLGAVALRADGVLVRSFNGQASQPCRSAHAEARVLRKCGRGAQVWVARVSRGGHFRLARPCKHCLQLIRQRGVVRVVYSVSDTEYGVIWVTHR